MSLIYKFIIFNNNKLIYKSLSWEEAESFEAELKIKKANYIYTIQIKG